MDPLEGNRHTMMVCSGKRFRTSFTNSTKCSEQPLATSRHTYFTWGIAFRICSSCSKSEEPVPELAARCCERNWAMSMSEMTWLVSQREWGGQGQKPSKKDFRKTGLRKGSGRTSVTSRQSGFWLANSFHCSRLQCLWTAVKRENWGEERAIKKERTLLEPLSLEIDLYIILSGGTEGLKSGKSNLKMSVVELRPQFHHYSPYKCNQAFPHKLVLA